MPASVPGQMPYAASPFASDFDAAQNAALRKRRLAEMLQQQAFAPDEKLAPGVRMSVANPLAKMFNAYMSTKVGDEADAADKANAQARQDALTKLLGEMPQPTPGQAAIAPSPAGAAPMAPPEDNSGAPPPPPGPAVPFPEMGPSRPEIAPQPVPPQEMAAYGAKFLPLGPAAAKIGEQFTDAAVKQMLPKPPPALMPVGGDIFDPATKTFITGPTTLAHQALAEKAQRDLIAEKGSERERKAQKDEEDRASLDAYRQQMIQSRYDLAKVVGALGGAGNTTDVGVDATNGMPVVRGKDGRRYTMDSATGKATPYTGEVIPQAQHEKNVTGAMAAETEARMADSAAKAISNPKAADAFDLMKRGGMGVGMSPQQAGVGPEGQAVLAMVGRDFAEQTKKLYGASFTDSEQKRAAGFTITNKDNAESARIKAEDAGRFAREMMQKYGGAAAAASARRMQGGGSAPAAATSDDGWGQAKKNP